MSALTSLRIVSRDVSDDIPTQPERNGYGHIPFSRIQNVKGDNLNMTEDLLREPTVSEWLSEMSAVTSPISEDLLREAAGGLPIDADAEPACRIPTRAQRCYG
jgi:hypothetical protein